MTTFIVVVIVLFSGCSSNSDDIAQSTVDETKVAHIRLTIANTEFYDEDSAYHATRSESYNPGKTGVQAYWIHGDSVGIFPEGGYQIPFALPVNQGERTISADIVATGWETKSGILYAVYHPFVYDYRNPNKLPYDLRVVQHQKDNWNQDNLGKYWIEGGDTVTPKVRDGVTHFDNIVTLMNTVILLRCSAPATANYTRMMLVSKKRMFATHGYFDLFDTKAKLVTSSKPVPYLHQPFVALDSTDHIILEFDKCEMTEGQDMYGYLVEAETSFAGQTIMLYLYDDQGNIWAQPKTIASTGGLARRNMTYSLTFRDTWTKVSNVDVQLNDWEKAELCPTCTPVAW